MTEVKCNCFNMKVEKFISGDEIDNNCPLCIDGNCTAKNLEVHFDGHYWYVDCPKVT